MLVHVYAAQLFSRMSSPVTVLFRLDYKRMQASLNSMHVFSPLNLCIQYMFLLFTAELICIQAYSGQ